MEMHFSFSKFPAAAAVCNGKGNCGEGKREREHAMMLLIVDGGGGRFESDEG